MRRKKPKSEEEKKRVKTTQSKTFDRRKGMKNSYSVNNYKFLTRKQNHENTPCLR